MTYLEADAALYSYFKSQWEARVPTVVLTSRNGPRVHEALDPETDSWVEFGVFDNFAEISSVGNRTRRMSSRVNIIIYTPLNKGDGRSKSLGDIAADIWDRAVLPGIMVEAPEFVPGGTDQSLPWWTDSVSTPFQFNHSI